MSRFEVVPVASLPPRTGDGIERLGVPKAWKRSKGEGAIVGVVDSGIAARHPDLAGSVIDGRDFCDGLDPTNDRAGHGTHVAGIIAARENHVGVVGVAPRAQLLNAKVVRELEDDPDPERVASAIHWCIDRGAETICLSLAWRRPVAHVREAIARALALGRVVVAAAGNRGPTGGPVGYPAAWPEALAVGYVEFLGPETRMSIDSGAGPEIDVLAPGARVLSTYPANVYARASGTSMAAPFVAGVLALLGAHRRRQGKPAPTLAEALTALRRTANRQVTRIGALTPGVGLIDPERFTQV